MTDEIIFRKRFGQKLNMLRKQKGITQIELAEELNYSDKAVSKWERGESVPDTFTVYKIAEYFGVTVDYFFSDESETTVSKTDEAVNYKIKSVKLFVPFMAMVGVFFVASVFFFVMKNVPSWSEYAYFPFIYSVPIASVVMTVFSSIWWNRAAKCVCASALIWSSAVAVYTSFSVDSIKYIFVCCVILQAFCVLAYVFGHFFTKSDKSN